MGTMTHELLGVAFAVIAVASGWYSWRRIASEPRRLSNAWWIGGTACVAGLASIVLSHGTLLMAVGTVLTLSPLLAMCFSALLLWNGVVMARRESLSLANSLSLLSGFALVGAMVLSLVLAIQGEIWLPLAVWIALATGWVGLLFLGFLAYSWLYQRLIRRQSPDFVVTLGAGLAGDRVTPLLARRIDRALEVGCRPTPTGRHPVLVMSGGKGPDEAVSEAQAMAAYAVDHGAARSSILLEDASRNTEENLHLTYELVQGDPRLGAHAQGVAVTSSYHAMRAAMLARRLSVPVQVVGARTAGYFWPSAVLREFVAVLRESWQWQVVGFVAVTVPLPLVIAVALW